MTAEPSHFRRPSTLAATLAELMALALAIRDEARDEAEEGRLALAWAARNRMALFGRDPCCGAKGERPDFADAAFCRAFAAACLAASGDLPDPTGGATHFHLHTDEPFWASAATPKALIGRHLFYTLDNRTAAA
jgi:spore germination cell wall hydrolase CwlJ-like protein